MKIVVLPGGILPGDALDEVRRVLADCPNLVYAERLDALAPAVLARAAAAPPDERITLEIVAHGATGVLNLDTGTAPDPNGDAAPYEFRRYSPETDRALDALARALPGRFDLIRLLGCAVAGNVHPGKADRCARLIHSGPCLLQYVARKLGADVEGALCAIGLAAFTSHGFDERRARLLLRVSPPSEGWPNAGCLSAIGWDRYQACEQGGLVGGRPLGGELRAIDVEQALQRLLPHPEPMLTGRSWDARGLLSIPLRELDGPAMQLVMGGLWVCVTRGDQRVGFELTASGRLALTSP